MKYLVSTNEIKSYSSHYSNSYIVPSITTIEQEELPDFQSFYLNQLTENSGDQDSSFIFQNNRFNNIKFSGTYSDCLFVNCVFENCDLSQALFEKSYFVGNEFHDTNFSKVCTEQNSFYLNNMIASKHAMGPIWSFVYEDKLLTNSDFKAEKHISNLVLSRGDSNEIKEDGEFVEITTNGLNNSLNNLIENIPFKATFDKCIDTNDAKDFLERINTSVQQLAPSVEKYVYYSTAVSTFASVNMTTNLVTSSLSFFLPPQVFMASFIPMPLVLAASAIYLGSNLYSAHLAGTKASNVITYVANKMNETIVGDKVETIHNIDFRTRFSKLNEDEKEKVIEPLKMAYKNIIDEDGWTDGLDESYYLEMSEENQFIVPSGLDSHAIIENYGG